MTFVRKILVGGAGLAAIAASAPSSAQYYGYAQPSYGYSQGYGAQSYGYAQPYARSYAYGYGVDTTTATQQCTTAVQNRLYTRSGLGGILGSLIGSYGSSGRVLSVTRVTPTGMGVRVRGLATSGRMAYGYGTGYPDLSFRCDVDYRGYVRSVDINRR